MRICTHPFSSRARVAQAWTQRHTSHGNAMTAQRRRRFARHAERSCRRSIDPTPAACWREGSAMAGRGRLGLGGQMCGRWCCRRCGSFGKPILNHQGSQHSDILENHICARHTCCIPYPVSLSSPHTLQKTLKTGWEGNWIVHVLLFERCSALARPRPL